MKCENCGAKIPEAASFCPVCGRKVERAEPEKKQSSSNPQNVSPNLRQGAPSGQGRINAGGNRSQSTRENYGTSRSAGSYGGQQENYGQRPDGYGTGRASTGQSAPVYYNPYDHTDEFSPEEISDNKVVCMVIYLMGTIGLIIGLLADHGTKSEEYKTSYIGFNVRQALKLEVFEIIAGIVAVITGIVIGLIVGLSSAASSYSSYGHSTVSSGLGILNGIGTCFLIPLIAIGIISLIVFIVRLICFNYVCKGKAIEAPIVRGIQSMR